MQVGKSRGMMLLNDSLANLVKAGTVEAAEAYQKSVDKDELLATFTKLDIEFDPDQADE